jgi:GntR family transcriptional regulator/MocR family aminotransferase
MHITLDRSLSEPVYRQLALRLRAMIESGALPAGSRLPPSRDLARTLGVNRATVTAAYDALGTMGAVEATVGRGTFVRAPGIASPSTPLAAMPEGSARDGNELGPADSVSAPAALQAAAAAHPVTFSRAIDELRRYPAREAVASDHPHAVDFAALYPDESLFPVTTFRRLMAEALAKRGRELLQYAAPEGDPDLRAYIASELGRAGVQVAPDDILVVNGAQQGLDLLLRTFVDPGDPVVVESPTYWSVLPALGFYRAEVIEVPMTSHGMDTDALAAVLATRRPKLIYTMPNFQNPTGITMSLDTRRELTELGRRHAVPIVEDDYEKDLRLLGAGLPSLKALAPDALIMHLGTFSKGLFPGVRLGWIAAPAAVRERLILAKRYADLHTSALAQAVIAAFCRGGHYARHIAKLHRVYRDRRAALLTALERHFPAEATWTRPDGGYALWVTLPRQVEVRDLLVAARAEGVVFTPGHYFFNSDRGENCLRLSIARADCAAIERGSQILGRLIQRRLRAGSGPGDRVRRAAAQALPHL